MKVILTIDVEQLLASLKKEERKKFKDLILEVEELFYFVEDILKNPTEDILSSEDKREAIADLSAAVFELHSYVAEERNDVCDGVSIQIGDKIQIEKNWADKFDWEKVTVQ
jgi:hypothetical protein